MTTARHKAWNDFKLWLEDMSRRERERDEIALHPSPYTGCEIVAVDWPFQAIDLTDEIARRHVEGHGPHD